MATVRRMNESPPGGSEGYQVVPLSLGCVSVYDGCGADEHEFANTRRMSPAQVLVAWVRAKQPGLLPLVGARTLSQWTQALSALDVSLSPADVIALEGLFPAEAIVGDRYAPEQMRSLDSER